VKSEEEILAKPKFRSQILIVERLFLGEPVYPYSVIECDCERLPFVVEIIVGLPQESMHSTLPPQ
jgi:hypothetical protein